MVLHLLFPAVIPLVTLLVIQLVNILATQLVITLATLAVITPAIQLDMLVILLVIHPATIAETLAHAITNNQHNLDFQLILKPVQRGGINKNSGLTHCILNRLSHTIYRYRKSPISILATSGYEIYIFLEKNG